MDQKSEVQPNVIKTSVLVPAPLRCLAVGPSGAKNECGWIKPGDLPIGSSCDRVVVVAGRTENGPGRGVQEKPGMERIVGISLSTISFVKFKY
jgi:hypothetical protein